MLTEAQLKCLEKAKNEREAHGEIETEHPGYLLAQDTYYVGNMKGVGKIYQQTVIDTYSRIAFGNLYTEKTAITAAHMLNDNVLPWFAQQEVPVLRILTDRGTEYCGKVENHAYQLYLAVENIDHSRTKAYSPQTNGIVERFHKTMKNEFYDIAFRKKLYHSLEELQSDANKWLVEYNEFRPHSGKYCYGKTPMQTLADSKEIIMDKHFDRLYNQTMLAAQPGKIDFVEEKNSQGFFDETTATFAGITPSKNLVQSVCHQGATLVSSLSGIDLSDNNW